MDYRMKVEGAEKVACVAIRADFEKFDGDVKKWQGAFFELLTWKNTWGIPLEMTINAYYDHTAYLYMVVKKEAEEKAMRMLDDLGYKEIRTDEITAVFFEPEYDRTVDEYYTYWH